MTIETYDSDTAVAEAAAKNAISTINSAITAHGQATWVLAGGSTPTMAYAILAQSYLDYVDWSKVTFIIGDERIGPLNVPDNNWQGIEEIFLQHIPEATFLRPKSDLTAEEAADEYQKRLQTLPQVNSMPRFDLVWLGMGPDGHTLSLFPDHANFNPHNPRLVVPVHNSPKPPADRISLTLHALGGATTTVVLATGESKRDALKQALTPESTLPIAQAAALHADTLWLVDELAIS